MTIKDWFLERSLILKFIIIFLLVFLGVFAIPRIMKSKKESPQYQTTVAQKGTLIISVSASGKVSSANNIPITTKATGVVRKIYVKDGQEIKAGNPVIEIELDRLSQQQYLSALAAYQSAKNTLESAKNKLYSLQATMFGKWDSFKKLAEGSTYTNSDGSPNYINRALPEFHIAQKEWLAAEADYKNQQNVIIQAQTALSSSSLSLEQVSPTVYAPVSGKIVGLFLQIGSAITSDTSSNTISTQKIASIISDVNPSISVNLTEIDIPKVKTGNKATVTFDAFPGKTYTGKVVSVDTVGTVSSGVTSYIAVIVLDTNDSEILSNMNATVNIITQTKDDVLLIPKSAVITQNGQTYVRMVKDRAMVHVPVEIGLSSENQIEIISGINEGDSVVTSIVAQNQRTTQPQSPFSIFGGTRGFGGGQIRIQQR